MIVVFRMEGGHRIGMGHVMRCLTLAKMLVEKGCRVRFLCSRDTAKLVRGQWQKAVCIIVPAGLTERMDGKRCAALLSGIQADWLVVDHYGLGAVYEKMMRGSVKRVMAVDDLARRHEADVVLDSAPGGRARYRGKLAKGRGLFGPGYALLRPGIAQARKRNAEYSGQKRVFVCFGGADPRQETERVARALKGMGDDVDFVVGDAYRGVERLKALCEKHAGWRVHVNVSKPELFMAEAWLGIGAGGTMTWERCAVGLPSVVVSIADNQESMSRELAAEGVIEYLGRAGDVADATLVAAVKALKHDEAKCERMRQAGLRLVDGRGAARVVAVMRGWAR